MTHTALNWSAGSSSANPVKLFQISISKTAWLQLIHWDHTTQDTNGAPNEWSVRKWELKATLLTFKGPLALRGKKRRRVDRVWLSDRILIHWGCSIKINFKSHLKVMPVLTKDLGQPSLWLIIFSFSVSLLQIFCLFLVPFTCVFNSSVHPVTYIITFVKAFL